MICPPDHKHAARTTCYYAHRCKCEPCADRARRDRARRKAEQAAGIYDAGMCDATEASKHVQALIAEGASLKGIAVRAGVSIRTVRSLLRGENKRVTYDIHDRIIAVSVARGMYVPAWRARRRMEALIAMGYPLAWIARESGAAESGLSRVLAGRTEWAQQCTARRLFGLYEKHALVLAGPGHGVSAVSAGRARALARARGYVAAAAWDDIDDPDAVPVGARRRQGVRGQASVHSEVVATCQSCGVFYDRRRGVVCVDCDEFARAAA